MKQLLGLLLAEVILIGAIFFGIYNFQDALVEYFLSAIEVNSAIIIAFLFFIILLLLSLTRESMLIYAFGQVISGKPSKYTLETSKPLNPLIDAIQNKKSITQDEIDAIFEYTIDRSGNMLIALPAIMVTLGLLGTFIGLSATIAEVALLMSSLSDGGDAAKKVELLFSGLPKAIEGMKLAFHTSLYGLGSSLVASLALVVYQHTQDDMRTYLREIIEKNDVLDRGSSHGEGDLNTQLLATAKVLNEQTSIFGGAIKLASTSITDQSKSNQSALQDLSQHSSELSQVVASLSNKVNDATETNNKLDILAEQVGALNATSSRGFSAMAKSLESTSKSTVSVLSSLQARHSESTEIQAKQEAAQAMIVEHLEKSNVHLSQIQESFAKQLLQETIKDQTQFELFKEEIGNVTEQVNLIDLYIKTIEGKKSKPYSANIQESKGFFSFFRK